MNPIKGVPLLNTNQPAQLITLYQDMRRTEALGGGIQPILHSKDKVCLCCESPCLKVLKEFIRRHTQLKGNK